MTTHFVTVGKDDGRAYAKCSCKREWVMPHDGRDAWESLESAVLFHEQMTANG